MPRNEDVTGQHGLSYIYHQDSGPERVDRIKERPALPANQGPRVPAHKPKDGTDQQITKEGRRKYHKLIEP